MKVITLVDEKFSQSCLLLSKKINQTYNPDLVIGILTGGGYVGRKIFNYLNDNKQKKYTEIKIQRKNTAPKSKGLFKIILNYSPTFLLNWMRILESLYLETIVR